MTSGAKKFFLIAFFFLLALLPLAEPPIYFISFLFMIYLYIILAESWNLIGGFAGYLSFGHVAFFGIGTYVSAMLFQKLGISPFIGCIPGGFVAEIPSF